jgi:two-component system, LytTR family, response regulator
VAADLRALIVDDEEPARARLRRMLTNVLGVRVIGEAHDGASAIEAIASNRPDVVLLDVQMPNGDGFSVIEGIGTRDMPSVIFVTAHDEHALRAFETRAIDYLLKPVREERLNEAIDRVRSRPQRSARQATQIDAAIERFPSRSRLSHLFVRDGERQVPLHIDSVDWIQADRNDVWVHAGGRAYLLRRHIGALAQRLDARQFAQINRSTIVRLNAVREVRAHSHGDHRVTLIDGASLTWTRRFRTRDRE